MLRSRRVRFAVPFAVAGLVALGVWLPGLPASASPRLARISPRALLVKVETARVSGLSGTVEWTANLGLADLSSLNSGQSAVATGGLDPTSLLSGTHEVEVWDRGASFERVALPRSLGETDFLRRGDQAWLWDSSNQHVTHYLLEDPGRAGHQRARGTWPPLTPEQLATRVLSAIGPSTVVSVSRPVYVAGQAAYVLTLAPRPGTAGAAVSTLRSISIAVDAANGFPLRFQVYSRGRAAPALSVGFTSLGFKVPPEAVFEVPQGRSETTRVLAGGGRPLGPLVLPRAHWSVSGPAWGEVASAVYTVSPSPRRAASGLGALDLRELTTPVSGSFGTGRLLHTALLNVLVLRSGSTARVLAGFVTPAALEAAAGR